MTAKPERILLLQATRKRSVPVAIRFLITNDDASMGTATNKLVKTTADTVEPQHTGTIP